MGRLIDADAFKRQIAGMTIANSYSVNKANALCELIDAQPIAYDVDAVVKQLEAVESKFSTKTTTKKVYRMGLKKQSRL